MAKARGVDAKLKRLYELHREAPALEHIAELRKALGDNSSLVITEAAKIAAQRVLTDLAPALAAAFDRFMIEPTDSDTNCRAKIAIVDALNTLEYDKEDVYLKAIRYSQRQRGWDGVFEDLAGPLRASAAYGLLRINYVDLMLVLVDLLMDQETAAREAAAKTLGETRAVAAILLLRFKALVGDKEPSVTSECLAALMVANPDASLPFVARFLQSPLDEIQQGAAFALGESRRLDALEVLKSHFSKRGGEGQEVILLAISMTRLPVAIDFLVEVLGAEDKTAALAAFSALAIHRHNAAIKERVGEVLAKKKDAALLERYKKKFEAAAD